MPVNTLKDLLYGLITTKIGQKQFTLEVAPGSQFLFRYPRLVKSRFFTVL